MPKQGIPRRTPQRREGPAAVCTLLLSCSAAHPAHAGRSYLPVGVAVEGRNHALCGRDPIDVALVDVDLDLERRHVSTMVQTPVRMKPPPALTGEIISPGWASVETATPLNGAADDSVLQGGSVARRSRARPRPPARAGWRSAPRASPPRPIAASRSACPIRRWSSSRHWRSKSRRTSSWRTSSSASARYERSVVLSSRARIEPSVTVIPFSTSTSTIRPVTLEDTVDSRSLRRRTDVGMIGHSM